MFTVWLPLAVDAREMASPEPRRTPVRSVAVVEDQADARRMLQFLLEAQGVTVFTAANGLEGAALIERVRPDLALVDLGLPVMSGYDLARRIRQNPTHGRIRLVALSGYGQDSDVQAALEAGFDEHLTKPPDPARLEQMLARTATPGA
jgi:CheY-like chemotaxis protein